MGKEEPKQTDENGKPLTFWGGLAEPKQETLEEAADKATNYYTHPDIKKHHIESFKKGANWQKERMYSKEDMKEAFHIGRLYLGREGDTTFEQWFKHYKKK